jgi:hypothetical protein
MFVVDNVGNGSVQYIHKGYRHVGCQPPHDCCILCVYDLPIPPLYIPVDKYEEPTWLQTYSICQIKNNKIKRVSDFIVELCYKPTCALFSAGDFEISGEK